MLEEECVNSKLKWVEELSTMLETKEKIKIQTVTFLGMKYLTELYLPKKL